MTAKPTADVCLILEGTYPYVMGGVASWAHELIKKHDHLNYHIFSILPRDSHPVIRYELPKNVVGMTTMHLQHIGERGRIAKSQLKTMFDRLQPALITLTTGKASLQTFKDIIETLQPYRGRLGESSMLNSEPAWDLITSMYESSFPESSMLDYFWSWRAIMGSLYSTLVAELPEAKCYHTLNTGYGGMFAARAMIETGRPTILTEHGIYTNERRIEIASANWLEQDASKAMTIHRTRLNLRDLWIDTFTNYSRICYEAASHIITLYTGNQQSQIADGAHPAKMSIIPNGVDFERYSNITKKTHPRATIALIGRIVPIKDIKSFLRVVATVKETIPDLRALIIGPHDEDPAYAEECKAMANYMSLQRTVTFTGGAKIEEYLPEIDVVVLTSISEVQPLVVIEAGALGIPAVVTDVGACREMVLGQENETPALGPGGVVAPLADTPALVAGICKLFNDRVFYKQCSQAMRERVEKYYNKGKQYQSYKTLYKSCM